MMTYLWKNKWIIDWNYLGYELSKMTPESIGDIVVQKINILEENGLIILPETNFSVDYIHIKKSWNILGNQLTVMNVSGGIIIGNLQDDSAKMNWILKQDKIQVIFSEVTIKFEPINTLNTERFSRKSTQKDWTLETPRLDPSMFENTATIDCKRDDTYTSLFVSWILWKRIMNFLKRSYNIYR